MDLTYPLDGEGIGNMTGSDVYSPYNNLKIAKQIPGQQIILHVELNAFLIAITIS